MQGQDRMRAAIAIGLAGHDREKDVEKFTLQAEGLVAAVLQGTKLKADDDRVRILGVSVDTPDRDGKEGASVAVGRRHRGTWFPFDHDHCVVTICWTNAEGDYVCAEIEYPCDVDWPILGRL